MLFSLTFSWASAASVTDACLDFTAFAWLSQGAWAVWGQAPELAGELSDDKAGRASAQVRVACRGVTLCQQAGTLRCVKRNTPGVSQRPLEKAGPSLVPLLL